jgi:F-type H+-transporting ATPase subunit delta
MRPLAVLNFSQALVELAKEKRILNEIQQAAEELSSALKVRELVDFLNHPKIPVANKREVLLRFLPANAPQEFKNFINLIIDRNRQEWLPAILEEVIKRVLEANGFEVVELVSARGLSETEQTAIAKNLGDSWSTKVSLRYRENPNLVGGIIVRRGDQLFDGSLAGQLKALKQLLIEEIELPI